MGSISFGGGGFGHTGFHEGSAPEPFNALNGHRLAGPQGSHPLHTVRPEDLLVPSDGKVDGEILLDHPARVGEGIEGTIRLVAREALEARGAALRLVGLKLVEYEKSRTYKIDDEHERTEYWVEANGSLFIEDAFMEPVIPAQMSPGQAFETRFTVPAPPLGPPSAHLGEAIVAWALEIRWDVRMGDDGHVAILVPVAQHPDLIRAGVSRQGGIALLDTVDIKGATISVADPLPAAPGSTLRLTVHWSDAPKGNARVELHRRTNAPNGTEGILASAATTSEVLAAGDAVVELAIPAGIPPSFDGAGLENTYIIRALVDRRFMPDSAIERPVSIA